MGREKETANIRFGGEGMMGRQGGERGRAGASRAGGNGELSCDALC